MKLPKLSAGVLQKSSSIKTFDARAFNQSTIYPSGFRPNPCQDCINFCVETQGGSPEVCRYAACTRVCGG